MRIFLTLLGLRYRVLLFFFKGNQAHVFCYLPHICLSARFQDPEIGEPTTCRFLAARLFPESLLIVQLLFEQSLESRLPYWFHLGKHSKFLPIRSLWKHYRPMCAYQAAPRRCTSDSTGSSGLLSQKPFSPPQEISGNVSRIRKAEPDSYQARRIVPGRSLWPSFSPCRYL